jgi:hypothetical protein
MLSSLKEYVFSAYLYSQIDQFTIPVFIVAVAYATSAAFRATGAINSKNSTN